MVSVMKSLPRRQFDVVVVGAGGAGMRCSLQLSQAGLSVAVLSKVFPTRSHTVAAQGGVSASLGNMSEDNWYWHMYDTVKGSDWLGDQDAIEFMCREAPNAVYELEHFGMPFDRNPDGTIYQRPFGGHTANFGEAGPARLCRRRPHRPRAAAHPLPAQRRRAQFFVEWMALDLLRNEAGDVVGVTALEMETGEIYILEAKTTVLATGGAGRIWAASTNAFINTGDGLGMAARAGIPLQDMEFWQFHPTGVAGAGVLITEGVRGEGGILLNKDGERFMERYAPTLKDLAPRDFVSRSMDQEIKEGRGCGPDGSYVVLKLDHLGADVINKRLPSIREIAIKFGNVDPIKEPIPVVPTIHYQMGGIPANYHGQVLTRENGENKIVNGLYAIGECAAVSVHGANRLGTNSLLDLIVFGRATGNHIVNSHPERQHAHQPVPQQAVEFSMDRVNKLESRTSGEKTQDIGNAIRFSMQRHCGVFRTLELLNEGVTQIEDLAKQADNIYFKDKSKVFNTARVEALELANMTEVARATIKSAANRTESRGAHALDDHPTRDDENWLKHTLWYSEGSRLDYKPVQMKPLTVESFPPKARTF